jgi:hypothetical protein
MNGRVASYLPLGRVRSDALYQGTTYQLRKTFHDVHGFRVRVRERISRSLHFATLRSGRQFYFDLKINLGDELREQ